MSEDLITGGVGGMDLSYGTVKQTGTIHEVPGSFAERISLVEAVHDYVERNEVIAPLCRAELEKHSDAILSATGSPPSLRGFVMVLLHNAVWRDIVAAVPFSRRTLMLPPCLRSSDGCKAEFDEFGLLCEKCGRCDLAGLTTEAEDLGYAVLIAEGTSIVANLIEEGMIDAVVGVSCLASLERAFSPVSATAVPGLAIPLLRDGCKDTETDLAWVREHMHVRTTGEDAYAPMDLQGLHREVKSWFEPDSIRQALSPGDTPVEKIAVEWLSLAGKRWRPFLSVAVFRALAGTGPLPPAVRDVALAVECIHKASLVYDDIQDGDACRYGEKTIHEVHGVPVALTVSLYLLGCGYRLLAECDTSTEKRTRMLALATGGHCELCLGQGNELWWMQNRSAISPDEVLEIFRKKTAPSFDVVFRLGSMCADASPDVDKVIAAFSEIVGVAYQIQDDLDDFTEGGDVDDVQKGRPSIMMALAYESATGAEKDAVAAAWLGSKNAPTPNAVREIMEKTGTLERANSLLGDHKRRALEALSPLKERDLKILLHRLVARVLNAT